jgi:glycosyltransferase involved in cell wall biosynthesis
MRILYLNHYAGSPQHGMEFRPYYLAREWVRSGHAVLMVAGAYSHVRALQPTVAGQPVAHPHSEAIDGIEYLWLPTPPYAGNGLARVRNIWAFLRQVWAMAPALCARFTPDVVIASSTYPMDIWVARRLARLACAKLVFEVHDLWPLSPIELGGMSPRHPFIVLCQAAENAAYRDADIVVSMLPKVAGHMAAHGLDLTKLHVVPNGISPDEWSGQAAQPLREDVAAFIAEQRAQGRLVVGYAGSHGIPNALKYFVDAAALLRDEPFAFVLVGDGMEKSWLVERARGLGLPALRFFEPVPKAQVPSLLELIDVAYIGWHRLPIYRFGIAPNKLLDYMMAGKAVLHGVEAGNDPVAEAGAGLTVEPESALAVAEGLRRLAAAGHVERAAMGERGRRFVCEQHTYPVLAARFLAAAREGA